MENFHDLKIGDTVEYISGITERPDGSCMLDWADDYCLDGEKYLVIQTQYHDVRIKGRLNPKLPAGSHKDEIWVNAIQMKKINNDKAKKILFGRTDIGGMPKLDEPILNDEDLKAWKESEQSPTNNTMDIQNDKYDSEKQEFVDDELRFPNPIPKIEPYLYSKHQGFDWYHYLHIKGGAGVNLLDHHRGKIDGRNGGEYDFILYYATPSQEVAIGHGDPRWGCKTLEITYGIGKTIQEAHADFLEKLKTNPLK